MRFLGGREIKLEYQGVLAKLQTIINRIFQG